MATTVAQAFADFKSNLEITGLQTETVSTRQQTIRRVLEGGLLVKDSFLTGSYARSTMISPLSEADIDIFMVLDVSYFSYGPAKILETAKTVLRRTYTTTPDISRNGQAVTIRFTDFAVDVVVGFYRSGGGYLIANSIDNTWLATDPKKHVDIMSQANKAHNGDLVPLIKMIKSWNKSHGSFFRSFHLEVLALEALKNVTISNFWSGLRFFFGRAKDLVRGKNVDPAGYGDDVGRYITTATVDEATRRFQNAFDAALLAENTERTFGQRSAIETWRKLVPNHFPAYG